ncbi:hypothetical protein FAZ15_09840 [Sphingobacterium olei]|uniref:NAD-dependent epimerase/dehydratase family protein n=1 Tax=Sphingobacterium olei TaxID=2571155 RepID=A0A4U0P4B4_9SPHI|nr:hypothetical protein [Sphingobacterium olei]TJZ61482.1 hypothetical protein FAZ15_09840 [Sphingobacterium olei]
MKQSQILVLGGKGKTGSRVAERLRNLGYANIRIGSRSAMPAFDWENQDSWSEVVKDVETICIGNSKSRN